MRPALPRLPAPDGIMPPETATDEKGRPHVIGYVFLRDRIGWAILAVLGLQAVLLAWLALKPSDEAVLRDLTAAVLRLKEK